MPHQQISFARRIIQANERLSFICYEYYRQAMSEEDFRSQRSEILKFIDEASIKIKYIPSGAVEEQTIVENSDATDVYPKVNV